MQADREHSIVVVERVLHAVAVMCVDVEIDDVLQAEVEPR